jgi:hypothetical protein
MVFMRGNVLKGVEQGRAAFANQVAKCGDGWQFANALTAPPFAAAVAMCMSICITPPYMFVMQTTARRPLIAYRGRNRNTKSHDL